MSETLSDRVKVGLRIRRNARQLQARKVREREIAAAPILLVFCARNERVRMAAFLAHYRRLGVSHFLVIDNQSTDQLDEFMAEQPDCSLWLADGSYRDSNFGMDWCNHLLGQYGVNKWCVTVDPDEFLVYPHCETRGLPSLVRYLDGIKQPSLFAPMIDAYGRRRLSEASITDGANPFDVCPYFDRFNFAQRYNAELGNFWIQGGVRMRRFFSDQPERAPALNKVPLVRWKSGYRYVSSMHHLNNPALNCPAAEDPLCVSGVLFHFKYVSLLQQKAAEEMSRGEHYAGGAEYKAYLDAGDPVLFDPQVSIRFRDSRQLQELGFMQAGGWY